MTASVYSVSSTKTCPICWEKPSEKNPMVAHTGLGNLHIIHLKCLKDCLEQSILCPICRVEIDFRTVYKFSKIDRLHIALFRKTLEDSNSTTFILAVFLTATVVLGLVTFNFMGAKLHALPLGNASASAASIDLAQIRRRVISVVGLTILNAYILKPKNILPLQQAFENQFNILGVWYVMGGAVTNVAVLGSKILKTDLVLAIALIAAATLAIYKKISA